LEYLEQRLPPGDTVLGLFAAEALLGDGFPEFRESAIRVRAWALGLHGALAEVIHGDVDYRADGEFIVQRARDGALVDLKDHHNESLDPFFVPSARVSNPRSTPDTSKNVELTTGLTVRIWSQPPVNSISIHNSGGTRALLPSPAALKTPLPGNHESGGYSTPFYFEKNVGQAGEGLDFIARGPGYTLGLSATEAIMALQRPDAGIAAPNLEEMSAEQRAELQSNGRRIGESPSEFGPGPIVHMQLVGANANALPTGVDQLVTKINYLVGNDPDHWYTNVPTYGRVRYEDVYPGIDLVYYSSQHSVVSSQHENQHPLPSPFGRGDGGEGITPHGSPLTTHQLEYDFIVAPGVDPSQIQLNFTGADKVEINAEGSLVVRAGDAELRQHAPYVYQEVNGGRQPVAGSFVLNTQGSPPGEFRVHFDLGAYDHTRPLVIDPMVVDYSTYLGGTNYDYGYDVAVDTHGNAYVTGQASYVFPLVNPLQQYAGGVDAFVSKFSQDGSTLLYSTYIGGSYEDSADSIALGKNSVYITGYTLSGDFPSTPGVFQPTNADGTCHDEVDCADAFVTRLNADGTALIFSTYLGTVYTESGEGIAVDGAGNSYVLGMTNSANFPVLNAAQPTYGGGLCTQPGQTNPCFDAFITKLNPAGTALVYSTYLGGNRDEGFFFHDMGDIAVDRSGYAYITGYTESANFPTLNAIQTVRRGVVDAYVTKLSPDGASFVYSTYLGGYPGDRGSHIAADVAGNAYVVGFTAADDFPTTPGSFQPTKTGGGDNPDAFVSKLMPDGSGFGYSTFLGGSDTDYGRGIAVDRLGNAYVSGYTYSSDFPTRSAFQPLLGGSPDAFLSKVAANGETLHYSSYLGGSIEDSTRGLTLDQLGNVFLTGSTRSTDFPMVKPFQAQNSGYRDAFVTKVSRFGRDPLQPA
jgi:hypothetical protein